MLIRIKSFSLSLLLLLLVSTPVHAEGYWGVKGGLFSIDNSNFDDAVNVGIIVGADLSNGMSLEGELTTTLIEGDTNTAGVDWSVDTFALFIAMRSAESTYLKLKAGYLDHDITLSPGGNIDGSGIAWGIGVGFEAAGSQLEIEFTSADDDDLADLDMLTLTWFF